MSTYSSDYYLELLNDIKGHVLKNPKGAERYIDQLKLDPRYDGDEGFKLIVWNVEAMAFAMQAKYKSALQLMHKTIQRAQAGEYWYTLSSAYNIIGKIYSSIDLIDKSLESYQLVLRVEDLHDIDYIGNIAYNNIGALYDNIGAHHKSIFYYQRAFERIQQKNKSSEKDPSFTFFIAANLCIQYSLIESVNEAGFYHDYISQVCDADIDILTNCLIHEAKMIYAAYFGSIDDALGCFVKARQLGLEARDLQTVIDITKHFCNFKRLSELSYDRYIHYILDLDIFPLNTGHFGDLLVIYHFALNYYRHEDDQASIEQINKRILALAQAHSKQVKQQHLDSMEVRFDAEETKKTNALIAEQNKQLYHLNEQLNINKEALENAYNRIQLISQIGQRITSSLDFLEVVELFYESIRAKMPVTSFLLLTPQQAGEALEMVAYYEHDQLQDNFTIDLKRENSMAAHVYNHGTRVYSVDLSNDPEFATKSLESKNERGIQSLLYLPLKYEDHVTGVFSIQSIERDAFNADDVNFIESLLPYLAIAINNATRSKALTHEIESHKKTQEQLRLLNDSLRDLSSIDGLTQVLNRRAFESRCMTLMQKAIDNNWTANIFMMDIDYFKVYNDTYGHLKGDEALVKVAKKINSAFNGDNAVFARFGGEEFIGMCISDDADKVKRLAEQIRVAVADLKIANAHTPSGYLTISIGLAVMYPSDVIDKFDLMREADSCLYKAKDSGRNKVMSCWLE